MNRVSKYLGFSFGLLFVVACDSSSSKSTVSTKPIASSTAGASEASPAGPGAYFLFKKGGTMVALEGGKFNKVGKPKQRFSTIFASVQGGVWLTDPSKTYRYAKGALSVSAKGKPFGGLSPRAESPDGTLWAGAHRATLLGRYDGKSWTKIGFDAIGASGQHLREVKAASDGTVFMLTDKGLHTYRDGKWSSAAIELNKKERTLALAVANGGVAYVNTNQRVLQLTAGKLSPVKGLPKTKFGATIDIAADGTLYVSTSRGLYRGREGKLKKVAGVSGRLHRLHVSSSGTMIGMEGYPGERFVVLKPGGGVKRYPSKQKKLDYRVKSMTVDEQDRVWAVSEFGVIILAEKELHYWTPGTVPELSRKVRAIAVAGKGPKIPDVGPPKLIAIKGRFVDAAGKPLRGVKVEICKKGTGVFYGRSPCAYQHFVKRSKTNAEGKFEIAGVPAGGWHFIYGHKGEWKYRALPGCCSRVKSGEAFDAGEFTID